MRVGVDESRRRARPRPSPALNRSVRLTTSRYRHALQRFARTIGLLIRASQIRTVVGRSVILLGLANPMSLVGQDVVMPDSIMTFELEEIVVTGIRTGGETLTLPLAVGVVGAGDFRLSRRSGLADALWAMPGVHVQSRSGSSDVRLTIRGFGARGNGDRSNSGTVRGLKVLLDGFPETEPDGRTSLDLVDLSATQRIEVLRTNASTLFGNASGGVVNVQTDRVVSAPSFELGLSAGDFGLRRASVACGSGFGGSRFWLTAAGLDFEGWRENSASRRRLLNGVLVSDLGDSTRLRLAAAATDNRYEIPGPLTKAEFDSSPSMANPAYGARRERRENHVGRFGASLTKWWDEHSLELLGYYAPKLLTRSERGTYRNFNRYHVGGGLTYSWAPAAVALNPKILAGLDEAFQDGTILFYDLENGERGDSLRTNKREAANALGAFAQLTLEVLPSVSVVAGARLDQQRYGSEIYAAGATARARTDQLSLSHITPRFGLLWRFSLEHSLYVNYGGGLEAPAFNEVDPPPELPDAELNPFLEPMSSTTLETGLKGLFHFAEHSWVRSLSYSVALYRIMIENEIVPFDGGSWYFSAGTSRRMGLEAGAEVEFVLGFSAKAALTLLDATYLEYENDLGDFSGNDVPGIAPVVLNAKVHYRSSVGLDLEAGIEYVGEYVADDAGTAAVPSFAVVGGAVSYSVSWGRAALSLNAGAENLFNQPYAASAYINPSTRIDNSGTEVPVYLEPGLPRNFFGGLSVTFML